MDGTSNTVEDPQESQQPEGPEAWGEEVWEDDEWIEEENWNDRVWSITKRLIALVFALSLLYVYGIHQGLLFTRTSPETAQQTQYEPLPSVADAEEMTLPVTVFVLRSPDSGSQRSEADIEALVFGASEIWDQAKIDLSVEETRAVDLSEEEILSFFNNPSNAINTIPNVRPGRVNIFLTRTLRGINGVAFRGLESVAVADYVTSFDFRVLAHEVGHILGLGHTQDSRRLMSQGSTGAILTPEEVNAARTAAERFLEAR